VSLLAEKTIASISAKLALNAQALTAARERVITLELHDAELVALHAAALKLRRPNGNDHAGERHDRAQSDARA